MNVLMCELESLVDESSVLYIFLHLIDLNWELILVLPREMTTVDRCLGNFNMCGLRGPLNTISLIAIRSSPPSQGVSGRDLQASFLPH